MGKKANLLGRSGRERERKIADALEKNRCDRHIRGEKQKMPQGALRRGLHCRIEVVEHGLEFMEFALGEKEAGGKLPAEVEKNLGAQKELCIDALKRHIREPREVTRGQKDAAARIIRMLRKEKLSAGDVRKIREQYTCLLKPDF